MRNLQRMTALTSSLAAITLFYSAAGNASAATDTWSSSPSGMNWNSTDWTGGNAPPVAGDALMFGFSSQTTLNNDFSAGTAFDGLYFTGQAFTLNGNGVLLSGASSSNVVGVLNNSGQTQTFGTLPLTLDWGYYTFSSSSGTLALNGGLTLNPGSVAYFDANNTSASLTLDVTTGLISGLQGAGLIYGTTSAPLSGLGPTSLATISGGSIIPLGTFTSYASGAIASGQNLKLSASGAAASLTAANGTTVGTITVAQAGNAGGSATTTLAVAAGGAMTFADHGGVYVLSSGAGNKGCFTLSAGSGGFITAGDGTAPASIVVAVNGDNPNNQCVLSAAIKDNTVSGPVSLIVSGSGALAVNSAASTYSGGVYVNQGQFQANITSVGTGPIYVATGATAFLNGAGTYTNNLFISPGFGTPVELSTNANPGAIFLSGSGAASFIGTLTLLGAPVPVASAGTVAGDRLTAGNVNNNNYFFAGQITGTGTLDFNTTIRSANFILTNTSVVNTNNWQGGLFIEESLSVPTSARNAVVKLGANNQIPSGPGAGDVTLHSADATVNNSLVRLDLNGYSTSINGLNAVVPPNNFPVQVSDLGTANSTLTLGGNDASGNYSGMMTDGGAGRALSLVKIGSGNQVLNGVDNCVGSMTVSVGTLTFGGNETVANRSAFNVASAGTLDVSALGTFTLGASQTINSIGLINGSLNINGTVNPSVGPIGTFTESGSMTLNGGSTYVWDINNATGTAGADPGWSLVNLTSGGQLTINASPGSPVTIKITSLDNLDQAGSANFNSAVSQTWLIAQSTTPVQNFNSQYFSIDTSAFANLPGGASAFLVTNATPTDLSGNNLYLVYTASPAISTALVNQTNNAGTTATFTVVANGATPPITFQWTQNGNPLNNGGFSASGGTVGITTNSNTSTLTIANVQDADAVGGISVSVSDNFGNNGVSGATLTVIDPPTIPPTVTQSGTLDNSAAGGRTYLAGSGTDGTPPLSYQWYLGANPVNGATSSTLAVNVSAATAGDYTLVVSNQAGSVSSTVVSIAPSSSVPNQLIYEPFTSYAQVPNTQPYPATFLSVTNLFNQLTGEPAYWSIFGTSGFAGILTNGLDAGGENQFGGQYPWPGLAGNSTNEFYWNDNNENYHLRVTTNGSALFAPGGGNTNIFFSCTLSIVSLGSGSFNGLSDVIAGYCSSNGSTAFNYELCVSNVNGAGNQCLIGVGKGNGTTAGNPINGTLANPLTNVIWTSPTQSPNGNELWVQQSLFVVGCYTVVDGPGGVNDTVTLWIDPPQSSYNAATPPAPLLGPVSFPTVTNSVIQDFAIHGVTTPASHRITDLRIGTTWASVTPPLAPTLSIVASGPNAIISWPASWLGYVLEQTPVVSPTSWTTNSLPPYAIVGDNYVVTNSISGARFFRLQHP